MMAVIRNGIFIELVKAMTAKEFDRYLSEMKWSKSQITLIKYKLKNYPDEFTFEYPNLIIENRKHFGAIVFEDGKWI